MACIKFKKLFGYEICTLEREGTLFIFDPIAVIRKEGYTEIFNIESMQHEIGDTISNTKVRNSIYQYILDNRDNLLSTIII
ncbi:MAG: hypothetical protein ACI4E1_00555 [Lachnospira sp.]